MARKKETKTVDANLELIEFKTSEGSLRRLRVGLTLYDFRQWTPAGLVLFIFFAHSPQEPLPPELPVQPIVDETKIVSGINVVFDSKQVPIAVTTSASSLVLRSPYSLRGH